MHKSSFIPEDFFELAVRLRDDGNYSDEATVRTILGRLYYALFLRCKDILEKRGWTDYNVKKIHHELETELNRQGQNEIRNKMWQFHNNYRVPSDYHLKKVSKNKLNTAFLLYEAIQQEIQRNF